MRYRCVFMSLPLRPFLINRWACLQTEHFWGVSVKALHTSVLHSSYLQMIWTLTMSSSSFFLPHWLWRRHFQLQFWSASPLPMLFMAIKLRYLYKSLSELILFVAAKTTPTLFVLKENSLNLWKWWFSALYNPFVHIIVCACVYECVCVCACMCVCAWGWRFEGMFGYFLLLW